MRNAWHVYVLIIIAVVCFSWSAFAEEVYPYYKAEAEYGDVSSGSLLVGQDGEINYATVKNTDVFSLSVDLGESETYGIWLNVMGPNTGTITLYDDSADELFTQYINMTSGSWGWVKLNMSKKLSAERHYLVFTNYSGKVDQVVFQPSITSEDGTQSPTDPPTAPILSENPWENIEGPYSSLLQNGSEYVSPSSGQLNILATDAIFPGKNGLDLSFTRIFSSLENYKSTFDESKYLTRAWELAFPKIIRNKLYFPDGSCVRLDEGIRIATISGQSGHRSQVRENTKGTYFRYIVPEVQGFLWQWGLDKTRVRQVIFSDGSCWEFNSLGNIITMYGRNHSNRITFRYGSNGTQTSLDTITDSNGTLIRVRGTEYGSEGYIKITDTMGREFEVRRTQSSDTIDIYQTKPITKRLVTYIFSNGDRALQVKDIANRVTQYTSDQKFAIPNGLFSTKDVYPGITKIQYPTGKVSEYRYLQNNSGLAKFGVDYQQIGDNAGQIIQKTVYLYLTRQSGSSELPYTDIHETNYGLNGSFVTNIIYYYNKDGLVESTSVNGERITEARYDANYRTIYELNKVSQSGQFSNLSLEVWEYDKYGNLVYHKDPQNYETTMVYVNSDIKSFKSEFTSLTGLQNFYTNTSVEQKYITGTQIPLFVNLPAGQLQFKTVGSINDAAQVYYKYNANGDIVEIKTLTKDENQLNQWIITQFNTYDEFGNVTKATFDAGSNGKKVVIDYQYNYNPPEPEFQGCYLVRQVQTVTKNVVDNEGNALSSATTTQTNVFDQATGNRKKVVQEWSAPGKTATKLETVFQYDELRRLTSVLYPDNTLEEVVYNDTLNTATLFDGERKSKTIHYFDPYGREIKVDTYKDLNGTVYSTSAKKYMGINLVEEETDPDASKTKYEYDNFGRVKKVTTQDGNYITYNYQYADADGIDAPRTGYKYGKTNINLQDIYHTPLSQKTITMNEKGQTTSEVVLNQGRNLTLLYQYDGLGNVILSRDPELKEMKYEYSNMGQLWKTVYPDGMESTYYDGLGNVAKTVDRNSNQITYEYNEYGQIIKVNLPDADSIVYKYNPFGQLVKVSQGTKYEKVYTYDNRNRVTAQTMKIDGKSYVTGYQYDKNNNITEIAYPQSTKKLFYQYDSLNRTEKLMWGDLRETATPLVSNVQYTPSNRIDTLQYGNNVLGKYTYTFVNGVYMPKNIDYAKGKEHLGVFDYYYDTSGNIIRINDQQYHYDDLGQLTQWDYYKENNNILLGEEVVWEKAMTSTSGLTLDKTQISGNSLQLTSEQYHNVAATSKANDLYSIYTNLIVNPNFETGIAGTTGLPNYWPKNIYNTNSSCISIVTDSDPQFNKCVKLDNTKLSSQISLNMEGVDIPVVAGKTYRQKGWMKGNGAAKLYLGRGWYDSTGKLLSYTYIASAVNPTAWTFYQGDVVAPANAVTCRIWCTNYSNTTGIGYFDNLEFFEVGLPVLNFEEYQEDATGLPAGWTLNQGTAAGVSIVADRVEATGTKVLKLDNTKIGSNTNLGVESADIPVTGGKNYRQSGWVKGNGSAQITLGVRWLTSTGTYISTSYILSQYKADRWYYAENRVTAPTNAAKCRIYLVNQNNTTGICYFDNLIVTEDLKTSEISGANGVVWDQANGYTLQRADQKIEYDELFPSSGRVNTTYTTAVVDSSGAKLPTNTNSELLKEEIVKVVKLDVNNVTTNRLLGSAASITLRKLESDSPDENWPDGYVPPLNSANWESLTSTINLGDATNITDLRFVVNCTVKNQNPAHFPFESSETIWVKFQLNNVDLGVTKFEADHVAESTGENTFSVNLNTLNIPNINAGTLKLYWMAHGESDMGGGGPIGIESTDMQTMAFGKEYVTYGTINSLKVYAEKENVYSSTKTYSYALTKTLQNSKVYKFTTTQTVPANTSISYELYGSSGKIMNLTNGQTFTVASNGSYTIKANLATTNTSVSPQINKIAVYEITSYPAQAILQMNTYTVSLPCTALDIYPTETLPSGTEIVYYANNSGNQTSFIQAAKISNGHYRVEFAQSGKQIVLRAVFKSNTYQSATPILSKMHLQTNAAYYCTEGTLQTRDLSISVPSDKLWLELHGSFTGGNTGVSIKIGSTTIQGTRLANQTVPLDSSDPYYTDAYIKRSDAQGKNLSSQYYEFVLPANLRGTQFTGRLTFTLSPDTSRTIAPSIYSYIVFGRLTGYATAGNFVSGWIDKPYSASKFKLAVTDTVPSGSGLAFELMKGQTPVAINEGLSSLPTDMNHFQIRGKFTSNKLTTPSLSNVTLTAVGETPYVNNLDATSDIKTVNSSVQIDQDHVVGQSSLRIRYVSGNPMEYLINDTWVFDVTKLPVLQIWVKPLTAGTTISFKTYDVQEKRWEVIYGDSGAAVGNNMVANQWNLLLLDLRKTANGISQYAKGLSIVLNSTLSDFCIDGISQLPENQTVYNYDDVGNRTSVVENGLVTTYYYYAGTNKLQRTVNANETVNYNYDANGNLTSKVTQRGTVQTRFDYVFNSLNQLVQVKKDGVKVAEYMYDEGGLRYKKVEYNSNQTTIYIYGLGTEPMYDEVYNNSNLTNALSKTSYLNMGSKRIARVEGTAISYYFTDHLGSTRMVMDGAGSCTYYDYAPFGEDFGSTGSERYKFTGKEDEATIGMSYFNSRYYEMKSGRFISEDPIKEGVNWYQYCFNAPLHFVDPTGTRVRITGNSEDVATLKQYLEEATGTEITLDKNGYIISVESIDDRFSTLQGYLNELLESKDVFTVKNDSTPLHGGGRYDAKTRTATINIARIISRNNKPYFMYAVKKILFITVETGVWYFTGKEIMCHELLGHGVDQVRGILTEFNQDDKNFTKKAENNAIERTNEMRRIYGIPCRPQNR